MAARIRSQPLPDPDVLVGLPRVAFPADMTRAKDIEALVDYQTGLSDASNVFVFCSGVGTAGPFDGYPATRAQRQLDVNYFASFRLIQGLLPAAMDTRRRQRRGYRLRARLSNATAVLIVAPPSTGRITPVSHRASGLARKSADHAMSQPPPSVPSSVPCRRLSLTLSGIFTDIVA
jgi:NAD(P)-dependent dehydrogenase (short-subunit alcohol dehydrogenase family)